MLDISLFEAKNWVFWVRLPQDEMFDSVWCSKIIFDFVIFQWNGYHKLPFVLCKTDTFDQQSNLDQVGFDPTDNHSDGKASKSKFNIF